MNLYRLALRSATYFWRTNAAIALGMAAAVAVLVGALLVGDSMRGSLRDMTLDRLGKIDDVFIGDHFFREALAEEMISADHLGGVYQTAVPVVMLPATTVETRVAGEVRRAVDATLFAVPDQVWRLHDGPTISLQDDEAVINQQLANDLGFAESFGPDSVPREITIRVTSRQQLSSDSALGKKKGLVLTLPDVRLTRIIPNHGLGRFGLHPTQMVPQNIFVSLSWLQQQLGPDLFKGKADLRQANMILLRRILDPPTPTSDPSWETALRSTLDDMGLRLSHVVRRYQIPESAEPKLAYQYFSLSSDSLVFSEASAEQIQRLFPTATPVFTYLANAMQVERDGEPIGERIPFSMVSGVDWGDSIPVLSAISGEPIAPLSGDEIVLNEWSAENLAAQTGDLIRITYFEPEAVEGRLVEQSVTLKLVDIAKLARPDEPYRRRGRQTTDASYREAPTLANDPDFTPLVPGLTDAESIESWSLPFDTPGIRAVDDDYWNFFRTTPKAFVSFATARRLWSSRFGNVTSFRLASSLPEEEFREHVTRALQPLASSFGLNLVTLRADGLRAASGSTPFDLLFLGLSSFVMLSAIILVMLLVRLGIQQRSGQLGILSAVGFGFARLTWVWWLEISVVCSAGGLLGAGLGIGYAQLMLWGLRTWWIGAIRAPFISLHISFLSIAIGTGAGMLIGLATIAWTLWRLRRASAAQLLTGMVDSVAPLRPGVPRWSTRVGWMMVIAAAALWIGALGMGGESQAGMFFGCGFCLLIAQLIFARSWLQRRSTGASENLSLPSLAAMNARRHPLRSVLTIGLVAVASFLIAAISAFRLSPESSGTAGFDFIASSNQPLFDDLNTVEGRKALLSQPDRFPANTTILSFRVKPGDDASCANPFQVTQPRVLGVPASAIEYLNSDGASGFAWAGVPSAVRSRPWTLLGQGTPEGASIPAIIDKNTAWYSLKIFQLGSTFEVRYPGGERVTFRLVGLLNNTILQGSILISGSDFTRVFPNTPGYNYFLIRAPAGERDSVLSQLENDLSDQGFDGRDAAQQLADLLAVQNTYLSAFQALGALGLVLGTIGLAAVQLRSVFERRRELAVMRAVGFDDSKLVWLVFWECFFLLAAGLGLGIFAAAFSVLPHFLFGNATVPWRQLVGLFSAILVLGWGIVWWASRRVLNMPLLTALREAP